MREMHVLKRLRYTPFARRSAVDTVFSSMMPCDF